MKKLRTACSLDCWDCCAIDVTLDGDKIINIEGAKDHPITNGFICEKGRDHINRVLSPNRLTSPIKKVNGTWTSISWDQAIDEIATTLRELKKDYGSHSILHYRDSGHCGLLKNIDTAFFNSFGGVTTPFGTLCWGAGIAAQTLDFGGALSHHPEDHINSKTIIIWGRNPVNTNIHLLPFLKKAKDNGANLVVIDPIKTATANMATHYFQIRPESDGFLALAMAKLIIDKDLQDTSFISAYSHGFDQFRIYVKDLNLDELALKTGLQINEIEELVMLYAGNPSSIILGYGLQRYYNGGKNIRYIDALGAMTGNIGISGGGVSYANRLISNFIDKSYLEGEEQLDAPTFMRSQFGEFILDQNRDNIKAIFVGTSNPVLQLPDTNKTKEAFQSIPFKVVIDHFMTDTAELADYVLPCTHIYEEEDFLYSSMWHSYYQYTERILQPRDGVKSEFEIYHLLATELGMTEFLTQYTTPKTYVEKSISPLLKQIGFSLDEIKGKTLKLEGNDVPWGNRVFATSSKKFEFINPEENIIQLNKNDTDEYPLHLLSIHPKHSLHSQHFKDEKPGVLPKVYASTITFSQWNVQDGDEVYIVSKTGRIRATANTYEGVAKNVLMVYEGWWLKNQGINHLTPSGFSDIGNQATFNNCMCRLAQVNNSSI